jgi:recombination protein RecR
MNSIDKLIRIFSEFPGIGPRQARRFVYYLLTRANGTLEDLSKNISDLKNDVILCADCKRFFEKKHKAAEVCDICASQTRDRSLLMIVQRDIDLESIEKNGGFNGVYFVLGGSVPILEKEPEKRIRIKELREFIEKRLSPPNPPLNLRGGQGERDIPLKEIILGVNWNPEGENTANFVERFLRPFVGKIKISHLGKGLSMGAELEYTDPDTLKNALKNRG